MAFLSSIGGALGGASLGSAVVSIAVDTSGLKSGLAKAKVEAEKGTTTMVDSFKKLGPAIAAAGAAGLALFAASSVKAFNETQQVAAQTAAVLKSTGDVSGYTADQIHEMAAALQQSTTYSDESVQSAENLLLTFKSIGSDIFPQTTQAVLDMSTALNQDLKSSAIQLGKALQDPLVGLTALRRVGVAFSADQVSTIEHLVETNDLLGAQKIILGEVTQEFGGSAAAAAGTFAGKLEQLKNSFNDFQELVGAALVSVLQPLVPVLNSLLKVIIAIGPELAALATGFLAFKAAELLTAGIGALALGLTALGPAFAGAATAATGLGLAMDAAAGPIGLVAAAIALVVLNSKGLGPAMGDAVQRAVDLASASKLATDQGIPLGDALKQVETNADGAAGAIRDLKAAQDALAGGVLGLTAGMEQVAEDQKELNRLQAHGKTGTQAYHEEQLKLLNDQNSLNGTFTDLAHSMKTNNLTLADAKDRIFALGKQAGISKGDVRALAGDAIAYLQAKLGSAAGEADRLTGALNRIPKDVTIRVTTQYYETNVARNASGGGP